MLIFINRLWPIQLIVRTKVAVKQQHLYLDLLTSDVRIRDLLCGILSLFSLSGIISCGILYRGIVSGQILYQGILSCEILSGYQTYDSTMVTACLIGIQKQLGPYRNVIYWVSYIRISWYLYTRFRGTEPNTAKNKKLSIRLEQIMLKSILELIRINGFLI